MDQGVLRNRLAEIAAGVFGCTAARFTDRTTAADIPGWDSLNHVKLLVAIEEAFGVRFGVEDLADPADWAAFTDMVAARVAPKE